MVRTGSGRRYGQHWHGGFLESYIQEVQAGSYKVKSFVIESQLVGKRGCKLVRTSGFKDPLRGEKLSVLGSGELQLKEMVKT